VKGEREHLARNSRHPCRRDPLSGWKPESATRMIALPKIYKRTSGDGVFAPKISRLATCSVATRGL